MNSTDALNLKLYLSVALEKEKMAMSRLDDIRDQVTQTMAEVELSIQCIEQINKIVDQLTEDGPVIGWQDWVAEEQQASERS